jgi:hypothetical protein
MENSNALSEHDGAELVHLINDLTAIVAERSVASDVYLHHHAGGSDPEGWRVHVASFGDGNKRLQWMVSPGTMTGLLDALRAEITALRQAHPSET